MSNPIFSVLVALYNQEQYLDAALESIFTQDFSDFEVLVVDDCSTDKSLEIVRRWQEKHPEQLRWLANQTNQGIAFTKDKCIREARGQYLGFVDPDDILLPGAIAQTFTAINSDEKLSFVYTKHKYFFDNKIKQTFKSHRQRALPKNLSSLELPGSVFHFLVFSRAKYFQTEGLDLSMRRAVDQDLIYKLEEVGGTKFIDEFYYLYRIHRAGISSAEKNKYKAIYWQIYAMQKACARRGLDAETIVATRLQEIATEIKDSLSYKLGAKLLKPLKAFKK